MKDKKRKKLTVSILVDLITRIEKRASKKKWDVDLLVEEAILEYLAKRES